MQSADDFAGGNPDSPYCSTCADEGGALRPFDAVLEANAAYYVRQQGVHPDAARERRARCSPACRRGNPPKQPTPEKHEKDHPMLSSLMKSVLAVAGSLATTALAAAVPTAEIAEAQLRAINHRFVGAFVHSDRDFMAGLIHTDFLRTASDGSWQDRDGFLAEFSRPSRLSGASYYAVRVRLYGDVAVTHAVFEALAADGKVRKVRYTDVYAWEGGGWHLVSGQNSLLQPQVPVTLQSAVEPPHATFVGHEPTGTDFEVLSALNAGYVQAFRNADVDWYAAHLAPEYVVRFQRWIDQGSRRRAAGFRQAGMAKQYPGSICRNDRVCGYY